MSGTNGINGSGGSRGKSPYGVRTGRVRERTPVTAGAGLSGLSGVHSTEKEPSVSLSLGLDATEARFDEATAYLERAGVSAMTLKKAVEVRRRNSAKFKGETGRKHKRQLLDEEHKSSIYRNLSSLND